MKKYFALLAVVGMFLGMASLCSGAEAAKLLVIDVRTEAEWKEGHLEGAILIPNDVIGSRIESVAKDKSGRIYLYCRSGRRSQAAKEALEKLQYKDVVNLGALEDAAKSLKRKIVK